MRVFYTLDSAGLWRNFCADRCPLSLPLRNKISVLCAPSGSGAHGYQPCISWLASPNGLFALFTLFDLFVFDVLTDLSTDLLFNNAGLFDRNLAFGSAPRLLTVGPTSPSIGPEEGIFPLLKLLLFSDQPTTQQ